ncbi:glycosyltransferase family 4 protein [Pseudorhodoplanes sp.]|uniref:glycosyltransferase family 4 protein n=1 Tax=Pseudorhodoplanes sp. TaxID=1934341 RepID=UPI003D1126A1
MAKRVVVLGSDATNLLNFRGTLIKEIADRGHQVIGIAPNITTGVEESLRGLGARAVSIHLVRSNLNPAQDVAYMRRLESFFRKEKTDTLIAYTIKPVVWGSIAAHRAGTPDIVAMITGLGYAFIEGEEIKRRIAKAAAMFLYKRAFARCRAVMFQNIEDRDDFVKFGLVPIEKTKIIDGSGIDTARFQVVPVPEKPNFLMLARLLRDKGIEQYARAAKIVVNRYPDAKVRLAGPLDPSPNAISPADVQQWSEHSVEYVGPVSDVRPLIGRSSVYVLPSYREGTPRSTLEAMSMGRAVVTTDVAGCRETVVDGHNGYLVPPRDHQALADAMVKFIVNPSLANTMGARSREIAENRYDVRKVNRAILEIVRL